MTEEQTAIITAQWDMPEGGVVVLPEPEDFLLPRRESMWSTSGTRLTRGLPLYVHEPDFDLKISGLMFDGAEADTMTFDKFCSNRLSQVTDLFGERIANDVFLNPSEWTIGD